MKASEVAYKAAQVMSEKGHCKRKLADEQGQVCFNGALNYVLTGDAMKWGVDIAQYDENDGSPFNVVTKMARSILKDQLSMDSWLIEPVVFNNDEKVSGEEVIQLLKEAGHRLEEQGL